MEKQYRIPITIAIFSGIMEIVLLFDQQLKIGYLLNYIFPCYNPDDPNSFPCYGLYSIYLFIFLFIVFVISIGYILELRKRAKKNLPMKPLSMILSIFYQLMAASAFAIIVAWIIANVLIFILK